MAVAETDVAAGAEAWIEAMTGVGAWRGSGCRGWGAAHASHMYTCMSMMHSELSGPYSF